MRLYLLVQSCAGMLVPPHRLAQVGGAVVVAGLDDVPYTPIQWEPLHTSAISRGQRLQLDMRARMRAAATASPLRSQVDATLSLMAQRAADGVDRQPSENRRPSDQYLYPYRDLEEQGTPCLADWIVR